jgi:ATP-binding cassette, subfamily B, multidrug efflux pump
MTTSTSSSGVRVTPISRENDWRLLRRLVPYARRNWKLLIISMVLLIPVSIAGAIQPILIGQAVSLIRGEQSVYAFLQNRPLSEGLNLLALLLLLTIVVRLFLDAMQGFLVQKMGQRITAGIRADLFHHVTSLAMRFFDRTPVGRLITRLTSDVDALGDVFSTGAIGIIGDLFSIVVIAVLMFLQQWQLAIMLVLMLLPVSVLIIYFQQQYRKANYRAREELSALNATLQENIAGIGVVQLFRREQFNSELFRTINRRYVKEVDKTIFHDSAVSGTLEWISLVAIAAVLWLGGLFVLQERLALGTLTTFILYAQRLFDPLRQFAEKFTAIQAGFTAIERVNDILNEPIEIRDPEVDHTQDGRGLRQSATGSATIAPSTNSRAGEICFEDVWLAYKEDEYVLQDLNFTIRPGEKVALVGPTGAGKSSIIRLLCRLYEVVAWQSFCRTVFCLLEM